jgi:hypothetical protein
MSNFELMFDHVGIPTEEPQPDEDWVESTKVWVTNPRNHKFRIEYLRYRHDTPCRAELVNLPHVAYQCRAEDFDALLQTGEVLIEPFAVDDNLTVAFILKDGIPTEYMVYKDPEVWFGKRS